MSPFILGHELAGEVVAVAGDVHGPAVGSRVVVNPARSCGQCSDCRNGRGNLCRRVVMLGSASTVPPTDGAFADFLAVQAGQCHVLPEGVDDDLGAMIEPFAVALHAVRRAGSVAGKSVLVLGGGPIGQLTLMTARAFGAAPVAVSDPVESRRRTALELGADVVLNPADPAGSGHLPPALEAGFEVVFEASGAAPAVQQSFELVRHGGTIVQIGTPPPEHIPIPAGLLMVREIQYLGSFRYGNVFDTALRLIACRRVDLRPLVSDVFPVAQCARAFSRAGSKDGVLKVQLAFSDG
jgi:L-idonate 5-dehydrogenase